MISFKIVIKRSILLLIIFLFSELNSGVARIHLSKEIQFPNIESDYLDLSFLKEYYMNYFQEISNLDQITKTQERKLPLNIKDLKNYKGTMAFLFGLTTLSILLLILFAIQNKSLSKSKHELIKNIESLEQSREELISTKNQISVENEELAREKSRIKKSNLDLLEKTKSLVSKIDQISTILIKPRTEFEKIQNIGEKTIYFKAIKNGSNSLKLKHIDSISSKKNTVIIKTNIGEVFITDGPLYSFKENYLPKSLFVQIHRSHIINLSRVRYRNEFYFRMMDGKMKIIGNTYKEQAVLAHKHFEALKNQALS